MSLSSIAIHSITISFIVYVIIDEHFAVVERCRSLSFRLTRSISHVLVHLNHCAFPEKCILGMRSLNDWYASPGADSGGWSRRAWNVFNLYERSYSAQYANPLFTVLNSNLRLQCSTNYKSWSNVVAFRD
jgi:hypothetical protein